MRMNFRHTSVAAIALIFTLGSCSAATRGSEYGYDCPDLPLVAFSLIDISNGGRDKRLIGERLDAVQTDAEYVSDCDGTLIVKTWSGSAANSDLLFAGKLITVGATEIGRDRKIPEVVETAMTEIRTNLNTMLSQVSEQGNNLVAGFAIVGEVAEQYGPSSASIHATIYSDGISTSGDAQINKPGLDSEAIAEIVASQRLPRLDGVQVALLGVGRVGGDVQPPQDFVELTKLYAKGLCEMTGATCSVFTNTVGSK